MHLFITSVLCCSVEFLLFPVCQEIEKKTVNYATWSVIKVTVTRKKIDIERERKKTCFYDLKFLSFHYHGLPLQQGHETFGETFSAK